MSVNSVNPTEKKVYVDAWKERMEKQKLEKEQQSVFNTYNDGNDDGKVDSKTSLNVFAKGMGDKVLEQINSFVDNAKKKPLQTAFAIGAGLAATAGMAVLATAAPIAAAISGGVLGAVCMGCGLYQLGKAVVNGAKLNKELKNTSSDKEALKILYNMGGTATEGAEGVLTYAIGARTVTNAIASYASSKVIELTEASNIGNQSFGSKFLNKFLTGNQKEVASSVLDIGENGARGYLLNYYEGNELNEALKNRLIKTAIDNAVIGTIETAAFEDEFVDLIDSTLS